MKMLLLLISAMLWPALPAEKRRLAQRPFHLVSVIAPSAADLDGDGIAHRDLTDETTCYDGGRIAFHDDGTFHYKMTGVMAGDSIRACSEHKVFGNWKLIRGGIRMIYENEDEDDDTITATQSRDKLVIAMENEPYPSIKANGIHYAKNGTITYIFKRKP